MGLQVAQLHDN